MRIVVAPDKFKGSLPAAEVARAVAAGLRARRPDLDVLELPVADGGDGTVAAAVSAGFEQVTVTAEGPTGESVTAAFGQHDGTAVLELAGVAGLERLPGGQLAPLASSTYGLGQLIAAALDRARRRSSWASAAARPPTAVPGCCRRSGCGCWTPMASPSAGAAARCWPPPRSTPAAWIHGSPPAGCWSPAMSTTRCWDRLGRRTSSASRRGPARRRSRCSTGRWRTGRSSAGQRPARTWRPPRAPGGRRTGYAALAYLGASIRPGIALMLEIAGFDSAVAGADLVITGEGGLDTQTLRGKAPLGVARAAARHGVPVRRSPAGRRYPNGSWPTPGSAPRTPDLDRAGPGRVRA